MQLKKKPTEENRKHIRFFTRIPKERIIYHRITDSPQIKNSTSATPRTSIRLSAFRIASVIASRSSPWNTP